ncbi:MAG TPA: FAD-dependent oxidoreductase, partial [Burkholderiales bacterium]|nr:FAD-dependent oxidoreductase [Burkholderiales bacterium]
PSLAPSARSALHWSLTLATLIEGADPEILSARQNVLVPSHPGGDRLVVNGYDALPKYLAQGLAIRLREPVVRIRHGARRVQVDTVRDTFEADYAIVTLPLGVLKAEAVRFDPELPLPKRRAIARLGMGVLDKVALRFSTAFWPAEPPAFGYIERRAAFPLLLNGRYYQDAPVLIAFAAGTAAKALEGHSDAVIVGKALAVVRRLFGAAVPDPFAARVTRWAADPYALGSYSHFRVGSSPADHAALAGPVGERLLFAGEAADPLHPATVHGALCSGEREANRILERH